MYPHPELNSFLQGVNAHLPRKILNRAVEKAMFENPVCEEFRPHIMRLASTQPQCYAPDVDVTQAKLAYGVYALPKLRRELHNEDPLVVRQAVTTLQDILVDPEKSIDASYLNFPARLSELLTSSDAYIRERVAMIYGILANQAVGRRTILKNLYTITNLAKGLDDRMAAVRLKIAQTLETLARDYCSAEKLCVCGFVESLTAKLNGEKKDILVVHLETLKFLLYRDVKAKAVEGGTFDKLMTLLERSDERVLCKTLVCLRVLCEDVKGKEKALQLDLLKILKTFLQDERVEVNTEAVRCATLVTITTPGKLRALELSLTGLLFDLIASKCCRSCELLLAIFKTLTNIAEAPGGRKLLLCEYMNVIEDMNVEVDEVLQRHKQTLLDVIRWQP